MQRRQRFVSGQVVLLVATLLLLTVLDVLVLELFFVVAFLGVLSLFLVTTPVNVTPRWQRRAKVLLSIGVLVFLYLVGRRLIFVLPLEWFW